MSQLTPEQARKLWADTLETTDIPQIHGHLAEYVGPGRCCLGVVCDLAIEHGVIDTYRPGQPVAPPEVEEWLGFKGAYPPQGSPESEKFWYQTRYSSMNDFERKSFEEIAQKVRELDA